jgi:hypothetical protein
MKPISHTDCFGQKTDAVIADARSQNGCELRARIPL